MLSLYLDLGINKSVIELSSTLMLPSGPYYQELTGSPFLCMMSTCYSCSTIITHKKRDSSRWRPWGLLALSWSASISCLEGLGAEARGKWGHVAQRQCHDLSTVWASQWKFFHSKGGPFVTKGFFIGSWLDRCCTSPWLCGAVCPWVSGFMLL
jgi:hypothetical protein